MTLSFVKVQRLCDCSLSLEVEWLTAWDVGVAIIVSKPLTRCGMACVCRDGVLVYEPLTGGGMAIIGRGISLILSIDLIIVCLGLLAFLTQLPGL